MTGDRNLPRTTRPLPPVLLTLLFLSGCSAWDNVSAYFNTYYNAAKVYDEAVAEVWALPELRSAGGDPLVPFTVPAGAKTKFTSVIEKCSKLLQYHPESGLVDNSLMMIGMSYYYQADYQRAQRKFLELIEGYPEGSFTLQARLMLARTVYKMNERQRAKELSTQLLALAEEEGEDEVAAHAAGILGRLAYEDGLYEDARGHFEKMADGAGNPDLRSFAYLRVATIDSVLGDYKAALDAYEQAEKSAANVGAEYKGAIGAARMESMLGDHRDALERLDDMGSTSGFRESFGEIALEIGHVQRRSGELDAAIEQYRFVDTAFVRTEASGAALYALGQIYETQLHDFDSARVMYNKAKAATPATSILSQPVTRRAEAMNKWAGLRAEITRYDSILAYIDSVDAARKEAPPDTAVVTDSTAAKADSAKVRLPSPGTMPRDTVEARLASAMTELATLYFLTLEDLPRASEWYQRVLNEHPDSRGAPRAMFALAELSARDTVSGAERADSLRYALIERYPDSEFAAVSRRILGLPSVESRSDTSGRMYAAAEALYLAGRNEEAIAGFQEVVDRFPTSGDAARSQYAIGFIYENHLGLADSAEAHYRSLVKSYPRTTFATTTQARLLEVDQGRKEMEAARLRDSALAARARDSLETAMRVADSLAAIQNPADTLGAGQGTPALRDAEKGTDSTKVAPAVVAPQKAAPADTTGKSKQAPPGEEPGAIPPGDESGPPGETQQPPPSGETPVPTTPSEKPAPTTPGEKPAPTTPGEKPPPTPPGGEPPPPQPDTRRPG